MAFIVLIIILGLVFYPYILTFTSNAKMLSKLRRIAEREAFRVIPLRGTLWIPRHNSAEYDLLIDGRGSVFAVKLVSAVRRNSFFVIRPDGTALVASKEDPPMKILPENKKKEKRGSFFGKAICISGIKENFNTVEGKHAEKILLIYPSFAKTVFFDGREEAELNNGDTVFEHTIYTPYGLEQKLCISAKGLPQGK